MAAVNLDIVKAAEKWLGTKYTLGGNGGPQSAEGTDCSGFIQQLFGEFSIKLPRTTIEQLGVGVDVDVADIMPGDCVYFGQRDNNASQHTGLIVVAVPPPMTVMQDSPHTGAFNRREAVAGFGNIIGFKRFWSSDPGKGMNLSGNPIDNIASGAAGAVDQVTQLASAVGQIGQILAYPVRAGEWLTKPGNLVRVSKVVVGGSFLLLGLYLANQDLIDSTVKKGVDVGAKVGEVAAAA